MIMVDPVWPPPNELGCCNALLQGWIAGRMSIRGPQEVGNTAAIDFYTAPWHGYQFSSS